MSRSSTNPPSQRFARVSHFHASPVHVEALARLHFLAENRSRLGVLLGGSGSGKTTLLERFASELRGRGSAVSMLSCIGLDPHDLLASLAMQWGCRMAAGDAMFQLWRTVSDRLTELSYEHVPALLLLDDAETAAPDVIAAVERLTATDAAAGGRLTVVCAADPEEAINLGLRLLDLAELRIELAPWDAVDVQEFVAARNAGGTTAPAFDAAATLRLQELSGGLPRKVKQLAQLAELAGAGQDLAAIDSATVDAVYEELSLSR